MQPVVSLPGAGNMDYHKVKMDQVCQPEEGYYRINLQQLVHPVMPLADYQRAEDINPVNLYTAISAGRNLVAPLRRRSSIPMEQPKKIHLHVRTMRLTMREE